MAGSRRDSGCRVSAAAIWLATGPAGQAAGLPASEATGRAPWTALVTNTSLAASSWALPIGVTLTPRPARRAARNTAALATPGSSRPSAGGVCSIPPITAKMFARSVSSTSPSASSISSCSPGRRDMERDSSASSRRSSHLCAPRPPSITAGRRFTCAGGRSSGTTSTRAPSGPPAGCTVIRSRPVGFWVSVAARLSCRAGGRPLPNRCRALASSRARWPARPRVSPLVTSSEVNTPAAGRGRRKPPSLAWPAPACAAGAAGANPMWLPMARTSGPALSRHSAYSASGAESATMPPPLPSQTRPAQNSKVRMATFSSRPATGLRYPTAPV